MIGQAPHAGTPMASALDQQPVVDPYLQQFGVTIAQNFERLEGHVLPNPNLQFSQGSQVREYTV